MSDLSSMSDEEFMEAWTAAGERVAEAKAECKRFSEEHNARLLKAEEEREADKQRRIESGEHDPSLDVVAGSVEEN